MIVGGATWEAIGDRGRWGSRQDYQCFWVYLYHLVFSVTRRSRSDEDDEDDEDYEDGVME